MIRMIATTINSSINEKPRFFRMVSPDFSQPVCTWRTLESSKTCISSLLQLSPESTAQCVVEGRSSVDKSL
jgi:hypothetical protein